MELALVDNEYIFLWFFFDFSPHLKCKLKSFNVGSLRNSVLSKGKKSKSKYISRCDETHKRQSSKRPLALTLEPATELWGKISQQDFWQHHPGRAEDLQDGLQHHAEQEDGAD